MVQTLSHRTASAPGPGVQRSQFERLAPSPDFARRAARLAADPATVQRAPRDVFMEVFSWGDRRRADLIPLAFELAHTRSREPFGFFDYQNLTEQIRYNLQEPALPYILKTYAAFPESRDVAQMADQWESWVPTEGLDALYSNLVDHAMTRNDFESRRKILADINRDMGYDGVSEKKRFEVSERMLEELLALPPGPEVAASVCRQAAGMLALPEAQENLEPVWDFLEAHPATAGKGRIGRDWETRIAGAPGTARGSLLEKLLKSGPKDDPGRLLLEISRDDPAYPHLRPLLEAELVRGGERRSVAGLGSRLLNDTPESYGQVKAALAGRNDFAAALTTLQQWEGLVSQEGGRALLLDQILRRPDAQPQQWVAPVLDRFSGEDQLNLARTQLGSAKDLNQILRACELNNARTLATEFWAGLADRGRTQLYRDTHQQLTSTLSEAPNKEKLLAFLQLAQTELDKIRDNENSVWLLAEGGLAPIDIEVDEDAVVIGEQVIPRQS